jgi:hypothetical protein
MTDRPRHLRPLYLLEVGKPYNKHRAEWLETPLLRLTPGGCELVLFYRHPTAGEILDVRTAPAEFGWTDAGPVSLLAYRFGDGPWSDVPYEPRKAPRRERGAPAAEPGKHLLVTVVLVDAATGIVVALRAVTWPPGFAAAVTETVARQLAERRDDEAGSARLGQLYTRSSAQLAAAAPVRWRAAGPAG